MEVRASTEFDGVSVVPWYADNVIYLREVRFSVPGEAWSEFENSQLFRDIVQYEREIQKRIQDTHIVRCGRECTRESLALPGNQSSPVLHESFWVRVHNRLRGIRSRLLSVLDLIRL